MDVIVSKKLKETDDIFSFELVNVNGEQLAPFTAGSHIDLFLNNGLIRQYSLCNSPLETHRYVIGVLNDPNSRGGSKYLHDQINEGDILSISLPRNLFEIDDTCENSILFAGGIGITPILCMAEHLYNQNKKFELHYCCRSIDKVAFFDRVVEGPYKENIKFHYDDQPETKIDIDNILSRVESNTHIYVCGPKGFIDFVMENARAHGWQNTQLHREYFVNDQLDQTISENHEFEIEINSTKQILIVPKDKTIIDVLNLNGIDIPVSCEQGVCGTCLTGVLSGVPDHKDIFMSEFEHLKNDLMTPCCSRSKSGRLVLDL